MNIDENRRQKLMNNGKQISKQVLWNIVSNRYDQTFFYRDLVC